MGQQDVDYEQECALNAQEKGMDVTQSSDVIIHSQQAQDPCDAQKQKQQNGC